MQLRIAFFLFCLPFMFSFHQPLTYTVSGKLIDDKDGTPIGYASIQVKGARSATTSAADGSFTIQVNAEKAVLVCSAVGYEQKEVKVKQNINPLVVRMKQASLQLQEVVVTAYGVSRDDMSGYATAPPTVSGNYSERKKEWEGGRKTYYNQNPENGKQTFDREGYESITENRFLQSTKNPLSTFSIDVDAASYANVRRFLNQGQRPPAGAVRIEEMINYFKYNYPQPVLEDPFSINTEIADCPWNTQHKIVLVGLQGRTIPTAALPAANLVFLVDVSGSMMEENKLPLVKRSLKLLVEQLREQDKVSLVTYAGNAGLVLPATSGAQKQKILQAIDQLEGGGSTAGGQGILLAYKTAKEQLIKGGNNRVILATDGDFNVGVSSDDELVRLIEKERQSGVFLSILGFGTGNYQDAKMQKLANKGNGNHSYIDNFSEARKVLSSEFGGTLFTIAKDVKIQIEFNPALVQAYRLIGYENRLLNKEDFNNDQKDAGELGSGHTVTALYEVIPVGVKSSFIESVDELKYQKEGAVQKASRSNEWMTIKFRYKRPDEDKSQLIVHELKTESRKIQQASENLRFAAAVAELGMLLRDSEFKQNASFDQAWLLARNAMGEDKEGYRAEFIRMIINAREATAQK